MNFQKLKGFNCEISHTTAQQRPEGASGMQLIDNYAAVREREKSSSGDWWLRGFILALILESKSKTKRPEHLPQSQKC
jgi:hypothetical protein